VTTLGPIAAPASGTRTFAGARTIAIVALVLAALAALPFGLSKYQVGLATEMLIYGVLAMSIDILAGFAGRTSLAHGAIFGISAYVVVYAVSHLGLPPMLAVVLGVIAAGTALVSYLLGLAAGSTVNRSISLGFYVVGSFLLISGFFVGNRGPVRVKGDPGVGVFGFFRNRRLRWASGSEQFESLSLSFVFVALGLVLIILGVVTDTRYELL
jgi:ABC-type branched-subunit amino acid transport system permease subunit